MSKLYRSFRKASVAISNRRQLGIGAGDIPVFRDPTPEQRKALEGLHRGIPCSPSMRWSLIRDNYIKPGN